MSTVIICIGVPASGKTTWVKEQVFKTETTIICRDDIRIALGLKHGDNEQKVTEVVYEMLDEAIDSGFDVVIADTNINRSNRNRLVSFCLKRKAGVELLLFPVSLQEAIRRDTNRSDSVGVDVITRMHGELNRQNLVGYKTYP